MNDSPPKLYKYMYPERASSVLGKLLIRFSQVSVMNDIEEFKPPINGIATEALFEQKFRERADALYPGYPGLMDLVEKQGPEYMAKLRNPSGAKPSANDKDKYEMNGKNFGILSLSEESTSAFMCERYADHGRGFLVEFDPSKFSSCPLSTHEPHFKHRFMINQAR
jgi:hypothetical protein